jgi:hypothetical protein
VRLLVEGVIVTMVIEGSGDAARAGRVAAQAILARQEWRVASGG